MPSDLAAFCAAFAQKRISDNHEVDAVEICDMCGNSGRRHVGVDPQTCQPIFEPCVCLLERPE